MMIVNKAQKACRNKTIEVWIEEANGHLRLTDTIKPGRFADIMLLDGAKMFLKEVDNKPKPTI